MAHARSHPPSHTRRIRLYASGPGYPARCGFTATGRYPETALDHLRSFMAIHFSGRPLCLVEEGDQVQSIDGSRLLKVRGSTVTDKGGHFLALAQMVFPGRLFAVEIVIGRDGAVAMIDDYPTDP